MKNSKTILFLAACLLIVSFVSLLFAVDWQEDKGEHFIVYFTQDAKFAHEVLNKAEVYYRRIARELGYPRYKEFWLWDKRVKIYIYPDHGAFLAATGQPQWSSGMADYRNKKIISYIWSQGFLESLLPHEMAHLIFRDFVGFKSEIPLWLDEGVAQWAEEEKREEVKKIIKQYYDKDTLLSLEGLMNLSVRDITDKDRVYIKSTRTKDGDRGVVFLSGDNLVNTYYIESIALVGFLIDKYGSVAFADFCRQLRDGKNLNDALSSAYPTYIHNINELEDRWLQYLKEQYSR